MARMQRGSIKVEQTVQTVKVGSFERRVRPTPQPEPALNRRPRRTEQVKNTNIEGPMGGWMKNPPESCTKKKQDKEGTWVETIICAGYCSTNKFCPVYIELMKGQKQRIRETNSH